MRTTVSLPEDLVEHVEQIRASNDESDAEAIRRCVRRSRQLAECQRELDAANARADDLRNQLMQANSRIDAAAELVEYVEEEQSYRRAGVLTRAKWWVFGMDED